MARYSKSRTAVANGVTSRITPIVSSVAQPARRLTPMTMRNTWRRQIIAGYERRRSLPGHFDHPAGPAPSEIRKKRSACSPNPSTLAACGSKAGRAALRTASQTGLHPCAAPAPRPGAASPVRFAAPPPRPRSAVIAAAEGAIDGHMRAPASLRAPILATFVRPRAFHGCSRAPTGSPATARRSRQVVCAADLRDTGVTPRLSSYLPPHTECAPRRG